VSYNFNLSGSNRRISFGGTGRKTGFNFSLPKSNNQFTQQQVIALAELMSKEKEGGSLLGTIFKGGKSALGWTLRQISRPNWAVAEGTRRALEGEGFDLGDFFKGASRGIQAKKHTTFSDVLKQEGVLEGHGRLRAVAGFGLDVLTDPTLPLLIAGTVATGGAASPLLAARLAMRGATVRGLERGGTAAAKQSLDEAADILRSSGQGRSNHAAWISREREKLNAIESGSPWTEIHEQLRASAEFAAKQELDDVGTRVVQARYHLPFTGGKSIPLTPTTIAGVRVAPKTPNLARTAKGEGVLAKLPLTQGTAKSLGKIFKHGFDSPDFAKPALIAAHAAEGLMETYTREGMSRFGQFRGKLDEDQMLNVLGWAERQGANLLDGKRNLRESVIERALIGKEFDNDQADFLRQWHSYWENMRDRDRIVGIDYTPTEGIYVPHIYNRSGGVAGMSAIMKEIGYAQNRKELRAIDELKRIKQQGLHETHDIEVDIMKLASARTRRAAAAHANQILKEHMRSTHGVPMRVPDRTRRNRARQKLSELVVPMDVHVGIRQMRRNNTIEVEKWANAEIERISNKYRKKMDALEESAMRNLGDALDNVGPRTPTFKSIMRLSGPKFNAAIKHFKPKDRAEARNIQGAIKEAARIRREVSKLAEKGAHGSKYRKLADEAVSAGLRLGIGGAKQAEVLTKDTSKTNIGYIAQPQGRSRVADTPKPQIRKRARPVGEALKPQSGKFQSWKGNILEHLAYIESKAGSDWDALRKKYPNPARVNTKAREAANLKARERLIRTAQDEMGKVQEGVIRRKNAFEEQIAKQFEKEERAYASAQRKAASLERVATGAMKRNPNLPPGYLEFESKLSGKRYAFRSDIHKAMNRVERILDDEEVMANFTTRMRKLMSIWKVGVTSINPGYRVRNTLSDLWNMYIAGVPTAHIMYYGTRAAAYQRAAVTAQEKLAAAHAKNKAFRITELSKLERKALEVYQEAYQRGVMSGLFQGDIQAVAGMFREGGITPALMKRHRPDLAFARMAQTFNRHGENWGRLTHYLYRRDYEKLSPGEAADWVKRAHFDYEELTPTEQQKFKAIMPFYTWTRKNIPYQLVQLVSRPGKYATFPKVLATSNELATGDTETGDDPNMPDWMQERYAFRVPFGENTYMLPQIGAADLSKLEHPSEFVTSMIGPHIKVPIEVATGKSMLTGQEIRGGSHPRNPVANWAANALGAIPGNPADVGVTARNIRGEQVRGAGASPWVSYAAGQLPMLNYFVNRRATIKQEQQTGGGPLDFGSLSYLGGISMYERDAETDLMTAQMEFQDSMARLIRGMRDEGLLPENTRKKSNSPYQLELQRLLSGG
jgi:hypothetical protein